MAPLVSAIMPTRGRRELAALAVECFLAQDYEHKRLVIVDDRDDPSFPDGLPKDAKYRQVYRAVMNERLSIGRKRNIACEIAIGSDLVAHFDSDDWSAPSRISSQVALLEAKEKSVTGFNSMLFYNVLDGSASRYVSEHGWPYACGTSMLYRRDWWTQHPFPEDMAIGEDNEFGNVARRARELVACDCRQLMVARMHHDNPREKPRRYDPIPLEALPAGFPR